MLTYLGDLGGLLDIVMIVGGAFTAIFSASMIKMALISSVYKLRNQTGQADNHEILQTKLDDTSLTVL